MGKQEQPAILKSVVSIDKLTIKVTSHADVCIEGIKVESQTTPEALQSVLEMYGELLKSLS